MINPRKRAINSHYAKGPLIVGKCSPDKFLPFLIFPYYAVSPVVEK